MFNYIKFIYKNLNFKVLTLGKLFLVELSPIIICLSIFFLVFIIIFQIQIENDFQFVDLKLSNIAYILMIIFIKLLLISSLFIHLIFSIQNIFFDYVNPVVQYKVIMVSYVKRYLYKIFTVMITIIILYNNYINNKK